MSRSFVDALVHAVDPIQDDEVEAWLDSPKATAARMVSPRSAERASVDFAPSGRRKAARSIALAVAALVILGAGAATAAILLGQPAPPQVKSDLRAVDEGFPSDLRYNPDVATARSVATTGRSTLYFAQLNDGGHCTEIVTGGLARGAICTTADQMGTQPIEVTIPFTDPVTRTSPVTIGGHVNATGVASLEILYGDGSSDPIPLGDEGFFVFDVPNDHVASVHESEFALVGLNEDGEEVTRAEVPGIGEEPADPIEDPAPISVDTISDGSDFTKVLGVRGKVNAEGAVSLEFRYPDGSTLQVPLQEDGSFAFDIPVDRRGDLFEEPGTLIARDSDGQEVASMPVAAVAFWRAHEGGP